MNFIDNFKDEGTIIENLVVPSHFMISGLSFDVDELMMIQ
jgi:hypothetical protein